MTFWRRLLGTLTQESVGHPADGRMLGLATALAAETRRRDANAEAVRTATAVAIDSNRRHVLEGW